MEGLCTALPVITNPLIGLSGLNQHGRYGVNVMDVTEREAIARKVEQALEGEEYSVVEMAHDLIRLARHPVWEEHDRAAADLEGAVEALRELRGKGRVHFGGCPWPMSHCMCKKAQAILAESTSEVS